MAVTVLSLPTGGAIPRLLPPLRRTLLLAADLALVVVIIGLYFVARGQAPDRYDVAIEVSTGIVRLEQALGIFVEREVQELSIRNYWVKEFANAVYAYLHFPVLGAIAVWLWWRGRERFVLMRNAMVVSMAIGLVFYYLLPAAPPRLMDEHGYHLGFTDTIFGGNTAISYDQPDLIRNDYAAIPSFHFGWIVLSSLAIWVNSRTRAARALALALAVTMTWSIVASANHFFIDMLLGGLVILLSWWTAARLPALRPALARQFRLPSFVVPGDAIVAAAPVPARLGRCGSRTSCSSCSAALPAPGHATPSPPGRPSASGWRFRGARWPSTSPARS
jgi:hypothetical protein